MSIEAFTNASGSSFPGFMLGTTEASVAQTSSRPDRDSAYFLPGSGFKVLTEMRGWAKELGYDPSAKQIETVARKTAGNIAAYYYEYLSRNLIVQYDVERRQRDDGEWRIWVPEYQAWLGDVIQTEEREGAVKKVFDELERELVHAQPGTIGVFTSPAGWSGLNGIANYQESQTFCYRVGERGKIEVVTIRSEMTLDQNDRLMNKLIDREAEETRQPVIVSGKEKIKAVVGRKAIFLESNPGEGFLKVLAVMREVMGTEMIHFDTRGIRTFTEAREQIRNRRQLLKLATKATELINVFVDYFCREEVSTTEGRARAAKEMGKTIIGLARLVLGSLDPSFLQRTIFNRSSYRQEWGYPNFLPAPSDAQVAAMLSQISGCAGGGGQGARMIMSGLGPRSVQLAGTATSGEKTVECCGLTLKSGQVCPVCGKVV